MEQPQLVPPRVRVAFLAIIPVFLSLAGCVGTPVGPGKPDAFPTRDITAVTVPCGHVRFIVSLNDDDDNANGRADHREPIVPANEDNIRELVFTHPQADSVLVADIIDLATHQSAVGIRVRAYRDDLTTPFVFNTPLPTSAAAPLKLCLEGTGVSAQPDDLGFEYQFFKGGQPLCGGFVKGTVVDVNAEVKIEAKGGGTFKTHRKMLITGKGEARGNVAPAGAGTVGWSYDGGGVGFANAAALTTPFAAGAAITDPTRRDRDQMYLRVDQPNHRIEAHFPINLTSPRHLEVTNNVAGFDVNSGWLDANQGQFALVPLVTIDYRLLDQFRERIRQSAYAGRVPQIRENIGQVLTSPLASVRNWIANDLEWAPDWIAKRDGTFTDMIEATGVNKDLVRVGFPGNPGRFMFAVNLQAVGGVLMNLNAPHAWLLSVGDGQGAAAGTVAGTANTFRSTVVATQQAGGGTQIQLRTVYGVVLP